MWDTVARNTIDQGLWDAPQLDRLLNNQPTLNNCCPVFDQKTFATKYDQVLNDKHKMSFYINREWRERNNSVAGRYGAPPGADQSVPVAVHAQLDDQGLGELGDQQSVSAPLRLRLQPLREQESQRLFQ